MEEKISAIPFTTLGLLSAIQTFGVASVSGFIFPSYAWFSVRGFNLANGRRLRKENRVASTGL